MAEWNRKQRITTAIVCIREAFGAEFMDGKPITVAQAIRLYQLAYKRGWFARDSRMRKSRAYRAIADMQKSA